MAALSLKEAGNAAFKRGNYQEALTCYGQAMKLDPSESTYPLNRAMAWLKLERYVEAERDATKSLSLLPSGNTKALFRRGLARRQLGKLDKAREDFEAALVEDPHNATIKAEVAKLGENIRYAKASLPSKTESIDKVRSTGSQKLADPLEKPIKMSESRREALKAAISPESTSNGHKEPDFMAPISTRRLHLDTLSRGVPRGTSPAGPPAPTTAESQTSKEALTAKTEKKDFRSLRVQREGRLQSAQQALLPTPTAVPLTSGAETPKVATSPPAVPPPKTTFEFERRWKDNISWQARAVLLESIANTTVSLPNLFGQNLSPEVVDGILVCLKEGGPKLEYTASFFLLGLPDCARFDFVSMLCGETALVRQILPVDHAQRAEIIRLWGA